MILNILDNDLYKFSTSYAYMKLYPEAEGTFSFTDRNNTILTKDFLDNLKIEFAKLVHLKLSLVEKNWCISHIPYIPEIYWEWLTGFQFDYDKIICWLDEENHLHIEVTDKLYKVTLYEVPILAIVSEMYSKMQGPCNVSEAEFKPANIVMKLSKCRINQNQEWRKCIKISDDLGKHLGDDKEFEIAKYQLGI